MGWGPQSGTRFSSVWGRGTVGLAEPPVRYEFPQHGTGAAWQAAMERGNESQSNSSGIASPKGRHRRSKAVFRTIVQNLMRESSGARKLVYSLRTRLDDFVVGFEPV